MTMLDDRPFDVFLSHSSPDKLAVEELARRLEDEAKLKPWLDKWNLVPGEPWQEALIECPYRVLEVFDEAHARFFFGREAMSQHLVEALRPTCFLAVLGPSGSGKSSLVRAGLLSNLKAGALPDSTHWKYLVLKPG